MTACAWGSLLLWSASIVSTLSADADAPRSPLPRPAPPAALLAMLAGIAGGSAGGVAGRNTAFLFSSSSSAAAAGARVAVSTLSRDLEGLLCRRLFNRAVGDDALPSRCETGGLDLSLFSITAMAASAAAAAGVAVVRGRISRDLESADDDDAREGDETGSEDAIVRSLRRLFTKGLLRTRRKR